MLSYSLLYFLSFSWTYVYRVLRRTSMKPLNEHMGYKKNLGHMNQGFHFVGAEGFEPPTLCL